jgi:hypothetical protein
VEFFGRESTRLLRHLFRSFHHFIQHFLKIFQAGGWDDDGVAPSAHVFGDAQKSSARIFLEGEDEGLALDLDFVGLERLVTRIRLLD